LTSNESSSNFFVISFLTSSILTILGILFLLLQISTYLTLLALIIFIIGIVQVIVDFGWLAIIKINLNLDSWKDAYPIVAQKRSQKIFLVPIIVDISFIIISLLIFVFLGSNL